MFVTYQPAKAARPQQFIIVKKKDLEASDMFGLGWPEIAIIAIVAIVIFGPKRIPEVGKALGKTLRGFKEELKKPSDEVNQKQEK